jgi:hypothetical protein
LCRQELPLERPAGPERMDRFLFSSPALQSEGQLEGLNSVRIAAAQEAVARVAAALGEVYPSPVAFDTLLPYAKDRNALRGILFALISSGFAEFHLHDFVTGQAVSLRPRASRLARWETAQSGAVTYSNHSVLKLDGIVRGLIQLLDGSREFDDIASGLARVEGAPPLEAIRARLPHILVHMANTGLLDG